MNASVEPLGVSARRRIDALAAGECDAATFLKEMRPRFQFESDESWEILSWLDQYYRRGKISADTYKTIKTGLAEIALGPSDAFQTPTSLHPTFMTEADLIPEPVENWPEPIQQPPPPPRAEIVREAPRPAPELKIPPRPAPEVKAPEPKPMPAPRPRAEVRPPEVRADPTAE